MPRNDFELSLVRAYNIFFETNGIRGIAYRQKQSRYTYQPCDIVVDSLDPEWYLAIEAKSVNTRKTRRLYFSQHFTTDESGIHQLDRMNSFVWRSGRRGFLAVELRQGPGRSKEAWMIPLSEALRAKNAGCSGLSLETIGTAYNSIKLERVGGEYNIPKIGAGMDDPDSTF